MEKNILHLQEKKKALADGIFNLESKTEKKLTVGDIKALFEPIG